MSNIHAALTLLLLALLPICYGFLLYEYKTREVSLEKYETVSRLVNEATRPYITASLQDGVISRHEFGFIMAEYKQDRARRSRDAKIVTIREDLKWEKNNVRP